MTEKMTRARIVRLIESFVLPQSTCWLNRPNFATTLEQQVLYPIKFTLCLPFPSRPVFRACIQVHPHAARDSCNSSAVTSAALLSVALSTFQQVYDTPFYASASHLADSPLSNNQHSGTDYNIAIVSHPQDISVSDNSYRLFCPR